MSRDAYRSPTSERWDRDRFHYERDRNQYGEYRERVEEDDHVYTRDGPPLRGPTRLRERSVDDRFVERRYGPRRDEDDLYVRERRVVYDDEPRRVRRSPPPEVERRITIEKERERVRSPSPRPARPGPLLRRQSSLDTFDRRPRGYYEREEYGPPARREDFRAPAYVDIPLPRKRALPPPRRYAEREYYDEIKVSEPEYYGDEEFRSYPERVREKEVIRTRRRERSRDSRTSRAHSHRASTVRSSSRSSSVSSSSSSSSGGTAVKSEYPKKGKTRIPGRLVSTRALIDLGYPFVEEGNTVVVQKALGQDNIDDLLKLSEDYKKVDAELAAARALPPAAIIEERREEIFTAPPPPPVWATAPAPVQVVDSTTIIRDVSPARSVTTTTTGPVVIEARPREISDEIQVGPLALVTSDSHRHVSRDSRAIHAEIRDLERELARSERHGRRTVVDRDVVKAERLSDGQLVLYEERVEKVEEPNRGVRIEKDKKGPPPRLMRAMLATLT